MLNLLGTFMDFSLYSRNSETRERKFSKTQKMTIIVKAIIGAEETLVVSEGEK
jgi:hypothetical protein